MRACLAVLPALLMVAACAGTIDPPAPLEGAWGGEHVSLVVDPSLSSTAALVEFDCATGRIDPPVRLGADGRFDVSGLYVQGHGGPVREGEPPDVHPARYAGAVRGSTMTLTVTVSDDPSREAMRVTLEKGVSARVFKCL